MKKRTVRRIRIGCVLVALCAFLVYFQGRSWLERLAEYWYDTHSFDGPIQQAAARHGLDARLVKALVFQESRFNPLATGAAGEVGLMQILPRGAVLEWARHHKREVPSNTQLYAPELNLEIGCWYLARAMKRWRSFDRGMELALCQYNAGPSRADSWRPESRDGTVVDRISIASTRQYVTRIMARYETYCVDNPFEEE